MSELLPCPFCRGKKTKMYHYFLVNNPYEINCETCQEAPYRSSKTEDDAIAEWNRWAIECSAQTAISEAVRARGYWDGWTPEQMVARQFVKLVEEVAEVERHVVYPYSGDRYFASLIARAGIAARYAFDDKGCWKTSGDVIGINGLKSEMADCAVVLLTMAAAVEAMTGEPFNLLGAAVAKATADVSRGVR